MPPTNEEQAIAITGQGKPKTRIKNVQMALAVYSRMRKSSETGAVSRSNIQGLYDGAAPYRKTELKRLGLSWMANIDWGEFRSTINRNVSSIWNMLAGTQNLIQLSTNLKDPQDPGAEYGNIVAREFTKILKKHWLNFHVNVRSRLLEMLKHGVGVCFWRDDIEWMSHFVRTGNVLVDATSKASIGSLNFVCLRDEMNIFELMQYVEDTDSSRSAGWNTTYVRKRLVDIFEKSLSQDNQEKYAIIDWESLAQAVKNEDFEIEASEFEPVRVVHMLSEEVTSLDEDGSVMDAGPVSHYIFLEDDDMEDKAKFFFEEENAFESMDKAIHLMMFNTGDGWIKSIRGLGREIFAFSHVSNRLINSILTGVDMASGLLIQNTSGHGAERFNVVKKGNFTLIPQDVSIIQQNFMPNIKSAAEVRQLIEALKQNNTGLYQNRSENLNQGTRTAEEVRTESNNEARFENDQAEWYYVQWEMWLQETFRRIMNKDYPSESLGYKQHKILMDNLKKYKVPKEYLDPDQWEVSAVRQIGLGSRANGLRITNEMVSMKAALDERGRRNVDREWFGIRVGWENVDKFLSEQNTDQVLVLSHSMAEGENVDMMEGHRRSVGVDDADKLHLDVHFRSLVQIVSRFREGQSPDIVKVATTAHLMLQHIAVHVDAMRPDRSRKAQVDFYVSQLKQLQPIIEEMIQIAQKLTQQQEEQRKQNANTVGKAELREVDRTVEIEKYKADRLAEVELHKANQLNVSREQKTVTSMQAQITKLQADLSALAAQTAADIARKDAETSAKIERQSRETAAT